MKKSEFGSGFLYNLVLFAKHAFMYTSFRNEWASVQKGNRGKLNISPEEHAASLFFYGACDHLQELEIPERYKDTEISSKLDKFITFCQARRLVFYGKVDEKDFEKAFEMLDEIIMLVDKDLGVKDRKAEWG